MTTLPSQEKEARYRYKLKPVKCGRTRKTSRSALNTFTAIHAEDNNIKKAPYNGAKKKNEKQEKIHIEKYIKQKSPL
jgi:hypothetical protein